LSSEKGSLSPIPQDYTASGYNEFSEREKLNLVQVEACGTRATKTVLSKYA